MKLKDHAFAIKESEENKDPEKCDTCGRIKLTECVCRSRTSRSVTFRLVVLRAIQRLLLRSQKP